MFALCSQGNAAEHVTSIWMALKGQMELTIGICVGSSIVSVPLSAKELLIDDPSASL